MRLSCTFAILSLAVVNLTGCGLEDTGPTAFNPATNVDVTFSSFTLTEKIEKTLFIDLFQAVEPAAGSDPEAQATADGIRVQLGAFLGLDYLNDPEPTAESVRNPLDLMRRVIGEDAVNNFTEARRYISSRIDEGAAGEYSNTTNDVSIRFTDQQALTDGEAISKYEWRYPIVKWVYTPATSARVTRVISWVASGTFPDATTRPSATLGTQFLPRDFQTSGYNNGARLHSEGSIVIEGEREMSFVREYDGLNKDTLIIDGTAAGTNEGTTGGPEFEFAGNTVDCLKIRMDYAAPSVDVFTSLNEPPQSPDYCLKLDSPTRHYPAVQTGLRN